jgi:transposase InsO family protein
MDLKQKFIEEATRPGANISALSAKEGITRQTGHKWVRRFKQEGYEGLEERSRAPHNSPLASAEEMVVAILEVRKKHPRWGPKKLHILLRRKFQEGVPSVSTIARVLRRLGQVRERRKRRPISFIDRVPTVDSAAPNDVWTVDFKGWWRAGDGHRCEPLTVRDALSRYVLAVRVMDGTSMAGVWEVFERLFKKHGLPKAIQCDNGVPFVQVQSRGGLTALSAWWISLGIKLIRSRPACPQDNGGHERMHRDLKGDVQAHPSATSPDEQRACDKWRLEFNNVRPHDALKGKVPADLYRRSERRSLTPVAFSYPEGWLVREVWGKKGQISVDAEQYTIGSPLAGHTVGLEPVQGLKYRIWFRGIDLGEIELAPSGRMIDQLADAALDAWPSKTGPKTRSRDDSDPEADEEVESEGSPEPHSKPSDPKKVTPGARLRSLRSLSRGKQRQQGGKKKKHPEDGQGLSSAHRKRVPNSSQVVHPT